LFNDRSQMICMRPVKITSQGLWSRQTAWVMWYSVGRNHITSARHHVKQTLNYTLQSVIISIYHIYYITVLNIDKFKSHEQTIYESSVVNYRLEVHIKNVVLAQKSYNCSMQLLHILPLLPN
jgi:hypothetical protein